jgi:hypothetical protein
MGRGNNRDGALRIASVNLNGPRAPGMYIREDVRQRTEAEPGGKQRPGEGE